MSGVELVLATRNPAKGREMARLLAGLAPDLRVLTLANFPETPDVPEDGATFRENALIKARAAARRTGLWAVADDSGLAVAWLGGRPGVMSARYAGTHGDDLANNLKVLSEMSGVPDSLRGARFVAAVAVVEPGPGGREWVVEGECHGIVAYELRGSGGFGYDSLFLVPELGKTFAELTPAEKDALSHRGRAFAGARELLKRVWGENGGQTGG